MERERGRARGHSAFSFVSKGNHARILDGEKRWREGARLKGRGNRSDRPTNRVVEPALSWPNGINFLVAVK